MNEQNKLPVKKDMYTEYKHIGPGPKDYDKTIVAPGHYRLTESTEYAKGDSSAEYEKGDSTKVPLIQEILKTHRELFSGQTEEELLDDYYYLYEHGVKGLIEMTITELEDLLKELKTEE